MDSVNNDLAITFAEIFPDYAKRMDAATNDEERWETYTSIVNEARESFLTLLRDNKLADLKGDAYADYALLPKEYNRIINSSGDQIKRELQTQMQKLALLKKFSDNEDLMAAQMKAASIAAITTFSIPVFISKLMAVEDVDVAILAGLSAVEIGVIVAAIEVIIICIVCPIIYFSEKPAMGAVLIVNELDEELNYKSNYFIHGDEVGSTDSIPGMTFFKEERYVSVGFFTGSKKPNALVGVQGGFTVAAEGGKEFAFAFDCPLTGLYVDNNCYCAIGETAKTVAELTDKHNKQSWHDEKDGYGISIKCNDPSGSIAYYVVRIYKS